MERNVRTIATGVAIAWLAAVPAKAAVFFDFVESGSDVILSLSGSLNTVGAGSGSLSASCGGGSGAQAQVDSVFVGPQSASVSVGGGGPCWRYTFDFGFDSFDAEFGPGPSTEADTYSGDIFWVVSTTPVEFLVVSVPVDYAGEALNGQAIFESRTLASMGITSTSPYVWTLPNDTITFRFRYGDPAVIPLPAAGWMLLGGLAMLGAFRSRRRQRG